MNFICYCSETLDRITRVFMQIALGIIIALFLAEVFARNVVGRSLTWVEEASVMYLGTWFVFIGAAHAMKVGMLISFEFLIQRVSRRVALFMFFISQTLILIFLLIIVFFGIRLSLLAMSQPSPALQLPVGVAYLGIVVGSGIMVVHSVASLLQGLSRWSDR